MILGRSPNLILGLVSAALGVVTTFHVGGFAPTTEQTGILLAFFGAVVAVIATTASIQIAAGNAAASRTASK